MRLSKKDTQAQEIREAAVLLGNTACNPPDLWYLRLSSLIKLCREERV